MNTNIKAVMFNIRKVVTTSPLISMFDYERRNGLPMNWLNVQITRRGTQGAWQRFERGEMDVHDFYAAFGQELSDTRKGNAWYKEYCDEKRIEYPPLPDSTFRIDGREMFGLMMRGNTYDQIVVEAIRRIRETGRWKVLALTNNFSIPFENISTSPVTSTFSPQAELEFLGWAENGGPASMHIQAMFDDFIDSSAVGKRKPEPEFYLFACEKHGLKPQDVIFLDDLGMNLRAARQLGMDTIHVQIGKSLEAIQMLESKLGIELVDQSLVRSRL